MALIISPNRPDSPAFARNPKTGFTLGEIEQHLGTNGKAFRLQNGGLILVETLLCGARLEEKNLTATCILRNTVDAPIVDVCGTALMLGSDESALLSPSVQAALFLDTSQQTNTALLLDRNEEIRSAIALGLESNRCRVIQARTAGDAVAFCQKHRIEVLAVDVSSLGPHALDTLKYMREAQPQMGILLLSGYDRQQVQEWHPRLLDGVQFLEKPLNFGVLGICLRLMRQSPHVEKDLQLVAGEKTDPG